MNPTNGSVEEGSEMEISETSCSVRRSSRTKILKRIFEIEAKGLSVVNSKPSNGVKMKGGASSSTTTTTDFVTPKGVKRISTGEVQKRKIMAALHNLGNTCFLNSVVQVLYHTPQFLDKINFLSSEIKSAMLALDLLQQLNYDGLGITHDIGWSLVLRLSELLKQMKKIDADVAQGILVRFSALRPYSLLETIEELNPEFKGNQQQDAHELLKCILMNIDEASNELNASRSKIKLCIGNGSRDGKSKNMVKNLESSAKELQTNLLLFEANKKYNLHTPSDADLKNNLSISWDGVKNEQEKEDMSCKASERFGLLTSDFLLGEKWSAHRGSKRKHGLETESSNLGDQLQFDCDNEDHIPYDDEISFKLKSIKMASNDLGDSQVSLIHLSSLLESQLQNPIVRDCCIRLHRFDSPLGMRHANIATRPVSNLVTEMFQGLMSLKTKCLSCFKETERKEVFQDISLPVRIPTAVDRSNNCTADTDIENKHVSVLQLILSILDEVEQLSGENCYYCDSCQHLVTAERRLCYDILPNILTIHLKRFAMNSSSSFMKTLDKVDIPLELSCLESNCRNQERPCHRYSLYGIVCHAGKSLVSGHYTSYVRVLARNKQDSRCKSSSQSCDSEPQDDCSFINKMSGDGNCVTDTSLDTLGNARYSVSYAGAQSDNGISFANGNVTMTDISLITTPSSGSESRNSVTPDSVCCNEDLIGHVGCNSGRRCKRRKRHCVRDNGGGEPVVYALTNASAETDVTVNCGDDSLWYKCNDDVITELTKQQLAGLLKASGNNITPYMLFYHKVSFPSH